MEYLANNIWFSVAALIAGIPIILWISSRHKERQEEIFKRVDEEIKKNEKLQEEYSKEKEALLVLIDNLRLEKEALLPKPKPIKPKPAKPLKYNKPKTLYIALDFNIRGNKSLLEVIKHLETSSEAVHTTVIHFLDNKYLSLFENIYLVKKNGHYIDAREFKSNPEIYTSWINTPLSSLITASETLKFKKDKKDI